MAGPSRKEYLKKIIEEYLEAGVGAHSWHELIDKMLDDGHTTETEIARDYGHVGFYKTLIRPIVKQRDEAGRDRFIPTKSGGYIQPMLAGLDDLVFVYFKRKHHVEASAVRLQVLREMIVDAHGVDPETLPDPTGGGGAEADDQQE